MQLSALTLLFDFSQIRMSTLVHFVLKVPIFQSAKWIAIKAMPSFKISSNTLLKFQTCRVFFKVVVVDPRGQIAPPPPPQCT